MKKRRQPDYIQPARMLWEEDTSKTRTDKAASDIEKDSTPPVQQPEQACSSLG